MLLLSFVITLFAFALLWAVHIPIKNAGVVDFYWGPGFAVIGIFYWFSSGKFSIPQFVLLALICIWAARLSFYLVARFLQHSSEDRRYTAMRRQGGANFWWVSLFKIFTLQAVIMWIIASPVHVGLLSSNIESDTNSLVILGALIFMVGFTIEIFADRQLSAFKKQNPGGNALFTSGLWSWSRHPNYFGEAVLWWGLGIIAFSISGSFWAFLGPAALTLVMVGVSAVITDRHMADSRQEKYSSYFQSTSNFVPVPPGLRLTPRSSSTKKDRTAL